MSVHDFVIETDCEKLPDRFTQNINDKSCVWNNSTPLILSLYLGKIKLAKDIFHKGADVTICNNFGNALHYAMGSHCNRDLNLVYKILDRYLDNGGDINLRDSYTKSSYLHYALIYSLDLCQKLLDLGINTQLPDSYGYTAIHCCCTLSFLNRALVDGLDGEGDVDMPDIFIHGSFYCTIVYNYHGSHPDNYDEFCGLTRDEFMILFDRIFDIEYDVSKIVDGDNLLTYCVKNYFYSISDYFIKRLIHSGVTIQYNTFERYYNYPEDYTENFYEIMENYINLN